MQENNPYAAPSSNLTGQDSFGESGGGVTQAVARELTGTKGWTQFMAILAFIFAGAAIIFAITGARYMERLWNILQLPSGSASAILLAIGIVVGVVSIIYGALLTGFSTAVGRLQRSGSETDLARALDRQRAFWVFWAVISILLIIWNFITLVR